MIVRNGFLVFDGELWWRGSLSMMMVGEFEEILVREGVLGRKMRFCGG